MGGAILGHFCFLVKKGGFSLFSKKKCLSVSLSLSSLWRCGLYLHFHQKSNLWKKKKKEAIGRLECYCIYILMETKKKTFLLACLYVLCQMPATDTAGIALSPPPPPTLRPTTPSSLSCSFSRGSETRFVVEVSDSPAPLRREGGGSGRGGHFCFCFLSFVCIWVFFWMTKTLDKSASRRLPGFVVVRTEAAERKRPIEGGGWVGGGEKRRETLVVFICLFRLLNVMKT